MTEAEKIALLEQFEALPPTVNRKEWLDQHVPMSKPHWYKWRKGYLASLGRKPVIAQKGGAVKLSNRAARAEGRSVRASRNSFREASREDKARLVQEYDDLPYSEKTAWRESHDLGGKTGHMLLTYYRARFTKEGLLGKSAPAPKKPSTALVPSPAKDAALIAEYDAQRDKKAWLESRGMDYHHIHAIRNRVARNGASHQPLPAAMLPLQIPVPSSLVSLEDAIDAMQVRIDHYTEVLTYMREMLNRGR